MLIKRGLPTAVFISVLFCAVTLGFCDYKEDNQPLITNVFYETDIREILRDISAQIGITIIPDETVQGIVSLELKEVPLEKALRMILSPGGFTFRKIENYYLVGSPLPTSPSFNLLTTTEYIRPNYILAEDVPQLVSSYFEPFIQVNKNTNTLCITASPEIISRFKQDLAKVDQAPRQIMIEAIVVELSQDDVDSLGITWGSMTEGGFSVYAPSDFTYSRSTSAETYTYDGTLTSDFVARINTLVSRGKAKIRAKPRIATLEGKEARMYVGREEWYLINTGSSSSYAYYTLQSISTGVVLKITPYISDNRQITVQISPEVSEVIGQGATDLPVVNKRSATTVVRVNDAETIVIGGLIQEQKDETINKVPFLGSIPLLGYMFRSRQTNVENKEVLILITPQLLTDKTEITEVTIPEEMAVSVESFSSLYAEEAAVKEYIEKVNRIINHEQENYEVSNLTEPKRVFLSFAILANGRVVDTKVLESSGSTFVDTVARRMIKDISPFPRFPSEIKERKINILVGIEYNP